MTDHRAKLFHERNVLLINFDRTTVTVREVNIDTVKWELDQAGFVTVGSWVHGKSVDQIEVRRKQHRFDVYSRRERV